MAATSSRCWVINHTLLDLHRAEAMLVEFIGTEKRLDEFTKGDARDCSAP